MNIVKNIENLVHEKILLFHELIEILEQEKKSIITIDTDNLWNFSKEKELTVANIEEIHTKILNLINIKYPEKKMDMESYSLVEIISLFPEKDSYSLSKLHIKLSSTKKEVRNRVLENKTFIDEYLNSVDEIIGVITNSGKKSNVYGRSRTMNKHNSYSNPIIQREA